MKKPSLETLFDRTVEPNWFTYADWQAIAEMMEKPPKWGYIQWIKHSHLDFANLTLADWEVISKNIKFPDAWAKKQLLGHRQVT